MEENKCPECNTKLEWTRLRQTNYDLHVTVSGYYCPKCLYHELMVDISK